MLALALAALGALPAWGEAVPAPAAEGERPQLLARQALLTQAFDREAADCRSRFVVTSCLEDVARRRRAAHEPLRERLLQLDEAQRQQRAQARREAVAAREQQRQRQLAEAAAQTPGAASSPAPRQRMLPPALSASYAAPKAAQAASQAEARAQAAQQRAAEAQRRAEEGAQRQQRVRRKLEQRAAEGRPLQPLPAAPENPQP